MKHQQEEPNVNSTIKNGTMRNIKGTNITVVVKSLRSNDKCGRIYTCENTKCGTAFPVCHENLIPITKEKR